MSSSVIDKLYAVTDKGPIRALSLVLALVLAGCVFWDPTRFAAKTSSLEIWEGLLLIWAVCAGVIHGFNCDLVRRITLRFFIISPMSPCYGPSRPIIIFIPIL